MFYNKNIYHQLITSLHSADYPLQNDLQKNFTEPAYICIISVESYNWLTLSKQYYVNCSSLSL